MKIISKIILSLVLILWLVPSNIQAQEGWSFGLSGGLNIAWISQPTVSGESLDGTFGSRLTYNVGLFAEYGFNKRFFMQMGLNFDQRGFTYEESDENSSTDATFKAHYLEIPFLFGYTFIEKEKFDLYGLLGPSFAYLTGGRIKGENVVNGEVGEINQKITDAYNTTAFGIKIGLGFEVPFADNKGATFFDVRYNFGLGDNINENGYYEDSSVKATSQVLSFVVGVRGYIE